MHRNHGFSLAQKTNTARGEAEVRSARATVLARNAQQKRQGKLPADLR
jgi:hypothetical protein